MYFISRYNKLFSYAVKVKPAYRYILTAGAALLLIAAWLFGVYFPMAARIKWQNAQIKQCQQQRLLLSDSKRAIKKLKQSVAGLHATLNSHSAHYVPGNQFESVLLFIAGALRKHKIALHNCIVQKEDNQEWYSKHTLAFDVRGSIANAIAFFDTLAHSHNMIACEDISVARLEGDNCSMKCILDVYEVH